MGIFALAMLMLLWILQTVFLSDFYRNVKTDQIKKISNSISDVIESKSFTEDTMQSYVDEAIADSDYCVSIYDETGWQIYKNIDNKGTCGLLISDPDEVNALYLEALNNGGTAFEIGDQDDAKKASIGRDSNGEPTINIQNKNHPNEFQSMTYAKIVKSRAGNVYFVMVNAKITMVNEVIDTLKKMLLIVMGIMLVFAIIIATIVSNIISKPIVETTKGAKELANGNLKVEFKGKGYLEIEELNETLNYASDQLSKVDNLRNELIANVSHDFRTPLTMIAGYSEIIRDLPNENTPENIQVIIDECNRLTRLVNDLLDLSKLQTNNQKINIEKMNITSLCKDISNRFNVMMKNEGYSIIVEADNELMVMGDSVRIEQVIYNITGNAIHFTGEDKKVVIRQIEKEDSVRIEISDSGKGIKEDEIPFVWDRYYKAQKVTKRQEVGTGIGLSIVRGILELHHAKYGVISKINEGTTFYFELDKVKAQ